MDVSISWKRLISWECKKQTIVCNSTTKARICSSAQLLWAIIMDIESDDDYDQKHIEIRFHFIRDCYEKRLIEVIKIHTDSNVADLLTSTRIWMSPGLAWIGGWIEVVLQILLIYGLNRITEASVRSKLQLADATGIHNLFDAEIYAGLATLGYVTKGDIVPLLPAMLAGAAMDQGEGSAQPAEPHPTPVDPLPSTIPITYVHHHRPQYPTSSRPPPHTPHQSPLIQRYINHHLSHHINHHPSPHQSPPHSIFTHHLLTTMHSLHLVYETPSSLRNVVVKLVKKVTSLETALKRNSKKVLMSESEGEEPEDQGRIIQDIYDDPLVSLVRESMKEKSTKFDEMNTAEMRFNYGIEDVNTGSTKVDTGRTSISTSNIIHSPKKGQKEGKAQMVEEDIQATHKTKEQIRQEEARLKEAIKLQAQMDEEVSK
ncbi:hypothetical protein Tco_0969833 [Tanacetum coccineum]